MLPVTTRLSEFPLNILNYRPLKLYKFSEMGIISSVPPSSYLSLFSRKKTEDIFFFFPAKNLFKLCRILWLFVLVGTFLFASLKVLKIHPINLFLCI